MDTYDTVPLVTPLELHQLCLSVLGCLPNTNYTKHASILGGIAELFAVRLGLFWTMLLDVDAYSQLNPIRQEHASLEMKTLPGHI